MDGKKGFYHAFGMCRFNLSVTGLWPKSNKTRREKIISFFLYSITIVICILFVNVSQTVKLVMIWGDLAGMIDNISTANLPIGLLVFKMLVFRTHEKVVGQLLTTAMDDWSAYKTDKEAENMRESAALARQISFVCVILGFGCVNGQSVVRIGQELDLIPGQPEKRMPVVSSYFPYDYRPSPVYELTWLVQYIAAVLATIVYSGIYCLFVGLVLHLSGQIANLRLHLENLDVGAKNGGEKALMQFRKNIGFLVEWHDNINRFAEGIERTFNVMFLAEILSCTIQICLQAFMLVTFITDDKGLPILEILFMLVYVLHIGTHLFICCYTAEKLRNESLSICESAYNNQWYELSAKDAKLLIIIMHRAEKPLTVTAGKFCEFSLQLFAQILKTSLGYLSMLLAVKERI